MHPTMQANKAFLQIGLILLPLYAVDSGASFSLEGIKAFPQPINGQVVEEWMNRTFLSFRTAFRTPASPWDTPYPALCRERVRLMSVLLDQRSSLLTLRRQSPVFVRVIHRVLHRCPTPRRCACGQYGLGLLPPF